MGCAGCREVIEGARASVVAGDIIAFKAALARAAMCCGSSHAPNGAVLPGGAFVDGRAMGDLLERAVGREPLLIPQDVAPPKGGTPHDLPNDPPFRPLPPEASGNSSLGPDAWWNPASPSFVIFAPGRWMGEKLRDGAEAAAKTAIAAAEAAAKKAESSLTPNVLPFAIAGLGEPSWGYYGPAVLKAAGIAAGVGIAGYIGYRRYQKRKRPRPASRALAKRG